MSLQNESLIAKDSDGPAEFKHAARRGGRRASSRRGSRRRTAAGIAGIIGAGIAAGLGLRSRRVRKMLGGARKKLLRNKGVRSYARRVLRIANPLKRRMVKRGMPTALRLNKKVNGLRSRIASLRSKLGGLRKRASAFGTSIKSRIPKRRKYAGTKARSRMMSYTNKPLRRTRRSLLSRRVNRARRSSR